MKGRLRARAGARTKRSAMYFVDQHNRSEIPGGLPGVFTRLTIRLFQIVLGLTVCGLYGTDLNTARQRGVYADSLWVYGVVCGGLGAFTSLIYLLPKGAWFKLFALDLSIFVLWLVLFAIFGKMYIHEDPENVGYGEGPGIQRMKNAVWVDLTNMLLWLVSGLWSLFIWWTPRRTMHTGRAED